MLKPKILLIERDDKNIGIVKELFEKRYDLSITYNLEDAVLTFQNKNFDLVLLNLTNFDYQIAEFISLFENKIPTIFITSNDNESIEKSFSLGAIDYITSPLRKQEVKIKISNHIKNYYIQKKYEEEIQRSRKKDEMMLQQSRLAQMGEMISMIAHQWRQPLASINGSIIAAQLDVLSNKYDMDNLESREAFLEAQDIKFKMINKQIKYLTNTIDDFRNFFKPNKGKTTISITEPIVKALDVIKVELEHKGIDLDTKYETKNSVEIYQNEVLHVLLNIIKNSEDNFCERNICNPKIVIGTKDINNKPIIYIRDNGGGIEEDLLPKIFDPYFSTKDEKNGTGIGLYMSKMIVQEYHGGELSVKNYNDGVEFRISF